MDLENQLEELEKRVGSIENTEGQLIGVINNVVKLIDECQFRLESLEAHEKNLKYEYADDRREQLDLFLPKMIDPEKTLSELIEGNKSIARFGDGEFAIMDNIVRQTFQRIDERLGQRLKEVINVENEDFMIAIADNYGNLDKYTQRAAWAIRDYLSENVRQQHYKYLKRDAEYYDAYISRPFYMYRDKTNAERIFALWKKLWNERNVIIVEGAKSRIGVGNDLFDNAKTIKRILAPAVSSFDRYDEILNAAKSIGRSGDLFLIAMGPSAGVLAYDLFNCGFQAADVGHIDLEYEWFKRGLYNREIIEGKYNNETVGGDRVSDENLPESYFEQIVADFS